MAITRQQTPLRVEGVGGVEEVVEVGKKEEKGKTGETAMRRHRARTVTRVHAL